MQRVIGLDIGSYSIKAVEIINSFSSYRIAEFYEKVIPFDDQRSPEQRVVGCMEELFRSNNLEADRIVTAMPGQYTSSRMLTFPFSDSRKIISALPFEVEDLVPFHLDEMILEHQVVGQQQSSTHVLVVMIQKTFLARYLDQLLQVGIDPRLVDVDSLSLYNLVPHIPSAEDELYGIVDIGHEKTSLCLVEGGMLRMFRTLKVGGKYITEVLARDQEISFAQSQQMKHQLSCIASEDGGEHLGLTAEELSLARQIGIAGYGFSKEIARTLYAFKGKHKKNISKIYISGGTTKLRGIEEYLEEQLNVTVERHDATLTGLEMENSLGQHAEVIPQALAIGLRVVSGAKKSSQINLRKGEFAYSQDSEALLKVGAQVLSWITLGSVILLGGYLLQALFYNYQINQFEEQYRKSFLSSAPSQKQAISKISDFAQLQQYANNYLNQEITLQKTSVQQFISASEGSPALEALKELSELIPDELALEVVLYDYATQSDFSGKITLQGETDGYGSVGQIKELITAHPSFEDVTEKSGPKPGSDGKTIAFTIDSTYLSAPTTP